MTVQSWRRRLQGRARNGHAYRCSKCLRQKLGCQDWREQLLDTMIERRLAAQGKTLVDAERIDRLRQAMSDLNDALRGLGS